MELTRVLAASLIAVTVGLGLQKAGLVARHVPEPPYPPTPAFLATEAARTAASTREAERVAARSAEARPAVAPAVATVAVPAAEAVDALPDGPGRDATFHACTGCHGTALIRRSRLSRDRWDELMDWMTERHGMVPLQGEARVEIVDYLAATFRPQRRGSASPFLTPD